MYKLVLGVIVASVLGQEVTAQLSLSTTGGVQCYGEQVTLLCTHPVLPQEPEFHQGEVNWRRDGVNIISVDDFGHRKLLNSTTTKLEFPITENTTGNYTCFLVNAVQRRVDESNTVTIRPPMLPPPSVTATPGITNISLHLEHAPIACSYDLSCLVSWSTAVTGGQGDGTINTTNTSILISPLQPGTQYTVSVQSVAQVEGMTLLSEKNEHVWTTGNSSNVSTPVVPSSTPSVTDQPDFDTPTSGPSGGDTAGIIVPIVVVAAAAVVATLMGIFLWKKKNNNQSCDVRGEATNVLVTEQKPLLMERQLSAHKTGHYEALNCEVECPNSEEKTEETELETISPVEEEQFSSDRTSLVFICHSEQVQPPADPFRTEFQVELPCSADAGFEDTLDEDSQVTSLPLMGCVTDETEALPFSVQVSTCTVPEDEHCSLVTGVTAISQESLTDQDMLVLPELTFGRYPSSMTADEKSLQDEELVVPEQEVTSAMDVPPSKLLSKSVVLTSAPPPIPGAFRCSAYGDRLSPDDIHSNGDTHLGSVHTDACELLKSEVKIPGNASELANAPGAPFRNTLEDDTVTTLSLQCSDTPVSIPMHDFPICVVEEEELPNLRTATPFDHHVTENLDVTASISMDEPSETHSPPESVNTNPQHSPPMPPHSTGDLGYQHVSRTDRGSRGGGSGKNSVPFQQDGFRKGRKSVLSKKQGLCTVVLQHMVLCSPVVCTGGGHFCTAA